MKQSGLIPLLAHLMILPAESIASWRTSTSQDEMTGDISAYAISTSVKPTKPMSFPFGETKAWLGVGCNSKSFWSYIGFSSDIIINIRRLKMGMM